MLEVCPMYLPVFSLPLESTVGQSVSQSECQEFHYKFSLLGQQLGNLKPAAGRFFRETLDPPPAR